MTRVRTAAVLMILLGVICIWSLFRLKSENDRLTGAVKEIELLYGSGDRQAALEKSAELDALWHEYEKAVTVIVHDEHLEQLNVSVARITPFIAGGNDELAAEIQSVYHEIEQIYEEEFPAWYNIL